MKNKYKIISITSLVLALAIIVMLVIKLMNSKTNDIITKVNLTNLTYEEENNNESIKSYNDLLSFMNDYSNNKLPNIYITKFLFDGVSDYKPYDLDDFIESGNDLEVESLDITVLNINTTSNIELSGELIGGMLAIDTNNVTEDINILLNNVKIDTDSKKVPVVYVYNKDITYDKTKVTFKSLDNTKNYLEGGKLKKVSLIPSESLDNYQDKYTGNHKTNYTTYTNYYGVYTEDELNNILFAKVTADNEDLADGDPYYFYKAAGAISSDIDLYFEGTGYLEVISKNKEGIETKGNLTFSGGTGDYYVSSQDDCLNTTTNSKTITNARNSLTIDVSSLYAIVSLEADEGDAIDSNGDLIINGGRIVAIAKPGGDAGIDSETGTYINGGEVLATGDMYDEIKSDSKQRFMVLSFANKPKENDIYVLTDTNNLPLFGYKTDRSFTNLVYSSPSLNETTYYLYKNDNLNSEENHGFYSNISSYEVGTPLGYSSNQMNNNFGGMPNNNGTPPDKNNMTPPSGNMPNNNNMTPPTKPDGMEPPSNNGQVPNFNTTNNKANNKEFTISGISNFFSGINLYSE